MNNWNDWNAVYLMAAGVTHSSDCRSHDWILDRVQDDGRETKKSVKISFIPGLITPWREIQSGCRGRRNEQLE
jgi:hypothetical protein